MDYLNLDSKEKAYIDELLSKDLSELTKNEFNTIVDYKAAWVAKFKYDDAIKDEQDKTLSIKNAYYESLSTEAKKTFDDLIAKTLAECED